MHFAVETIDPDIARVYLSRNMENNRRLQDQRVERYSRDMAAGRWVVSGEGIKFDTEGLLIDGQNRLSAVIRANVAVQMLVVRDVPREAAYVIDSGAPRSVASVLQISGDETKNRQLVVAAIQVYTAYARGYLRDTSSEVQNRHRLSASELMSVLGEDPVGWEHAGVVARTVAGILLIPSSITAAAYRILSHVDTDLAEQFFAEMVSGSYQADGPIGSLIRKSVKEKLARRKIGHGLGLFLIIRTWNAWRTDAAIQTFATASRSGAVAIPTPQK